MPIDANITLASLDAPVAPVGPRRRAARRRWPSTTCGAWASRRPPPTRRWRRSPAGNQQKVALSRWLATKPSVLILDEPTQGVDVGAKAEIHRLMVELAAQGVAIVMISSEMPEILGMSDRIAVMRGGRLAGVLVARRGDPGEHPRPGARRWAGDDEPLGRYKRELAAALAWAAVLALVALARLRSSAPSNLRDLALNNAPVLLVATGMTLVILVGQIDISVGSQFAIVSVCAGLLAKAGVPRPAARCDRARARGGARRRERPARRPARPAVDHRDPGDARRLAGCPALGHGGSLGAGPARRLPVVRPRAGGRAVADRRRGPGRPRRLSPGCSATWPPAVPSTRWGPTARPRVWPASSPRASSSPCSS